MLTVDLCRGPRPTRIPGACRQTVCGGGAPSIGSTLSVMPANGWKIATGLPPVEGQPNAFRAENFDILYDSPFEVSNFKEIKFEVRGVPHRIVIDGEGNYDPQ